MCGHNFLVDMYLILPPLCLGKIKFNTYWFFVHGGSWAKFDILHTKAVAWAGPSQGQALVDGFGLACVLRKPKLPQAKKKP